MTPVTRRLSYPAMLIALCLTAAPAFAQYVPAGLQGNWKVKRNLTEKSLGCFDPAHAKALIGAELRIGDHEIVWQGLHSKDLDPKVTEISAYNFQARYGKTPQELGITGDKISITLVNPSEGIPINALTARGPALLLIDACNIWLEAVPVARISDVPNNP